MTTDEMTAQLRIEQLLNELAGIIGPEHDNGDTPVLVEWVVVGTWDDGTDNDEVSVLPSAGMRNHHTTGLLNLAALEYGQLRPVQ
jgi:hypothetical protein